MSDDYKRDLQADLAVCNAAREGPWTHEYYGLITQHDVAYGPAEDPSARYSVLEDLKTEDARMIAQARTGWPIAIRRAMAAEALLRKLMNALTNYHKNGPFGFDYASQHIAQQAESLLGITDPTAAPDTASPPSKE